MAGELTFRRLTSAADPAFERAMELYAQSFPLHEQRMPDSQRAILSCPSYHFDVIFDGAAFVGDILYWRADGFAYVEHFCINQALRGQGYGQRALHALCAQGGVVILEIDPPTDDVAVRRQSFYERCGFVKNEYAHIHPPYRAGNSGHKLVIMSWPRAITRQEYDRFNSYLKASVMGQ